MSEETIEKAVDLERFCKENHIDKRLNSDPLFEKRLESIIESVKDKNYSDYLE